LSVRDYIFSWKKIKDMQLVVILLREIVRFICVILIASILVFFVIHISPKGKCINDDNVSWIAEYSKWMIRLCFKLDLGVTEHGEQISTIVLAKAKNSVFLITISLIFAIFWTVCFLLISFWLKQHVLLTFVKALFYTVSVCPSFAIGYLFLHFSHNRLANPEIFHDPLWYYYIIPGMILGINDGVLCEILRHTTSEINRIKRENYIMMSYAKGANVWKHMKNELIIHMSRIISLHMVVLMSGAVIVECIFSLPGLGSLAFNAAESRDVELLLGILVFVIFVVILLNFVNRMIALCMDPRLRE
jgi:peptide/nickel transport system permease protein